MQERILIAPNGTELLRMLARNGIPALNFRVMQPTELAQFALIRSGMPLKETFITPDTEAAIIYHFLPEIAYFKNASYRDAQNLADALRMLRMQITENERETIADGLKASPFTEKNEALLAVYDKYMQTLRQSDQIDSVGILREAIRRAKPLSAACAAPEEFPLTPLEQALLSHVSGGTSEAVSLCTLLQKNEAAPIIPSITAAYGTANEVEAVIAKIFAENLPLDQCVIAVTDAAAYAPLLFEYISRFEIPATFGCGLPITLSFPAGVLRDCRSWLTSGHCGIDALKALIGGAGFDTAKFCEDFNITDREQYDKFIETAGNLRLSDDTAENSRKISAFAASAERDAALVSQLTAVFVDFGMDCAELIRRYAKIRSHDLGRLDKAAQNKICRTLEQFSAMTGESPVSLIADLLQTRICAETSREGALHITNISGAMTSLRQNLFVTGLSAELFPGAPSENYLLLDDELAAFGSDAPTSLHRIRKTQTMLHDLLKTANALGVRTELSYCEFDTAEIKDNNASSVLFALYQQAGGTNEEKFTKLIRHTGYFSQDLSAVTEIGKAYLRGEKAAEHLPECAETPSVTGLLRNLSPTKIETFMRCPKKFCFAEIMQIAEPETDDVFQVIDLKTFGILVHKAMEYLCDRLPDEDAFMENAERIFTRFLTERPPMNQTDADKMLADYLAAVRNGFYRAADISVTISEKKIETQYDCGITVYGKPDAVAKLPDGSCRVIDYKTGTKQKHENNDAVSCIQVMMYADMLRRLGKPITGGEYWYLRLDRVISCEYTENRPAWIEAKLAEMADAIRTNTYPANASKDQCKYCPYREICEEGSAAK